MVRVVRFFLIYLLIVAFSFLLIIKSNPYVYFDLDFQPKPFGKLSQFFIAEIENDFSEENSIQNAINRNVFASDKESLKFVISQQILFENEYYRFDPCNCEANYKILGWGIGKWWKKESLSLEKIAIRNQIIEDNGVYISTGIDPQFTILTPSFKDQKSTLEAMNFRLMIELSIGLLVLLLLIFFRKKIAVLKDIEKYITLTVPSISNNKYLYWSIFTFPLVVSLMIYLYIKSGMFNFVELIIDVEGFGEKIQAAIYLTNAFISFYLVSRIWPSRPLVFSQTTIGFAFLFLFLEEISFGERLIGFQVSALKDLNRQNETNLHNIPSLSLLHLAIILVGIYGSIGWIALRNRKIGHSPYFRFFIIPRIASLYFLTTAIFYVIHEISRRREEISLPYIQEGFEFLLALGFALFVLRNFKELIIDQQANNKKI
jgi:hypothetical protein